MVNDGVVNLMRGQQVVFETVEFPQKLEVVDPGFRV